MVYKQKKEGFSVLEVIIALAIIALLSALVLSSMTGFRSNQLLSNATEEVIGVLNYAKTKAMSSSNLDDHGVRFEDNDLLLFQGSSFDEEGVIQAYSLSSGVEISDLNIEGGNDIVFNQLTGQTSNYGYVQLVSGNSVGRIIIDGSGIIYEE